MGKLCTLFSGGFSPATLPGLALWLDAQDSGTIAATSARVSQWSDKSGKGNHALQATGNLQPLYVSSGINGKPALQFRDDGTNKTLIAPNSASLAFSGFSAFAVFQRITDMGTLETIFGKFDTGNSQREWRLIADGTTDNLVMITSQTGSSSTVSLVSAATAVGTPYIGDGYYTGGVQYASVNNGSPVSASQAAVFNGTSPLAIGCINTGATQPFAGYIGELLFYNAALSAAQRLQVLQYLSAKWGVAIA